MAKKIKQKKPTRNNTPSHTQTDANRRGANWRVFWSRAAVLWLFGGFWFFAAINPTDTNYFSNYDAVAIGVLLSVVFTAQTIALTISAFVGVLQRHLNLLFAAFAATNFYYILLVVNASFNALPIILQLVLLLLTMGVAWALFAAAEENKRFRLGVLAVGGVLCAQAALTQAAYQWKVADKLGDSALIGGIGIGDVTSSPNVRAVEFARRPNIYLLSFDGMVPGIIGKNYLNRDTLDYETTLQKHGFRKLNNHFSDGPVTRETLNKMLALDPDYYYGLSGDKFKFTPFTEEYTLFAGLTPAPVWEIFKANGYETYASSYDHFLGAAKGPYLDNYLIPAGFAACATRSGDAVLRMFFHYCQILLHAYGNKWIGFTSYRLLNHVEKHRDEDVVRLLAIVQKIVASKRPSIFLSYFAIPGHTQPPYNYNNPDARNKHNANFAKNDRKTAAVIGRIMKKIKQTDPQAIVYIFGDHGAMFTRPVDTNAMAKATAAERNLYVLDNYATYGGVYPADICGDSFAQPFSPDTITTSEVVRHLIRCLANGQDPVINPIRYPLYFQLATHTRVKWGDSFDGYQYE